MTQVGTWHGRRWRRGWAAVIGALVAFSAAAAGTVPAAAAATAAAAAAPINDNFAAATVLNGSEGLVTGTNAGATKEPGEPNHIDNIGGSSVWYSWSPPVTGHATIGTAGSNFDTLLAVYTGNAVGSLTELVASDDASFAAGFQSAVGFRATAGVVYRIAVDGFADSGNASDTGTIVLRWSGVASPASINVTAPNGGETVAPGSTVVIGYTYAPPAVPPAVPPAAAAQSSAPSESPESDLDAAAATAAREGSVQSIVRLNQPFTPEGHLGQAHARAQRHGIGQKRQALLGRLQGSDHAVVRTYDSLPLVALRLSPAAVARLRGAPEVAAITEDRLSAPSLAWSTPLVEGPNAHAAGFDGTGQMVAVLDSGVDKAHPFLAGKVLEEACYSLFSECPNGQATQTGPGSGVPCTYAPRGCAHGTHVAGIAAGSGADSSGVARGASVMAVQVFHRVTGPGCTRGEDPCALAADSDRIAALERVYALRNTHSFAAVNMSIGGGAYPEPCDDEPEKLAIDNLRSAGIPTIISAGNLANAGALNAPACISTAISVGNSTHTDAINSESNSASFLSLLAPGTGIVSSVPGGALEAKTGTSMAAPHVAGAWAVMKQYKPTASIDEVLTALQATGRPILDGRNGITKPRIRLHRALVALDPRVRIDLLRRGVVVSNIVDNLSVPGGGIGSYNWAVPPGLAPANDYTVRVTSVPDPRATDVSNANFSITGPPATVRPPADFDGDGDTDVSVFRPSNGYWFAQGGAVTQFGTSGDIPVPGNFDGDGDTDVAVYRPSTGYWFVNGGAITAWGTTGDVPVPGDYDGDGDTDVAVYRPSNGYWFVNGGAITAWGTTGDIPVPGDYDGDGDTDVAVYRPSSGYWFVHGGAITQWGTNGDIPVPGDYDGDGDTDVAVFRPSNGYWFVNGGAITAWGTSGDVPVPGDYDGDGDTDVAVFRPANGYWFVNGGAITAFGANGDIPLPLPNAIRAFFYS